MSSKRTWVGAALVSILLSGSFIASAQASVFNFSFFGPVAGPGDTVSGSGQFITTGTGPSFTVTGVTGTVTDLDISSIPFVINGNISSYASSDNVLYYPAALTGSNTTPGFVDFGGISFQTLAGLGFDFNLGGYSQSGPSIYVLNAEDLNPVGIPGQTGSTIIDLKVSSTPLPSTWSMLLIGFVGLGFFAYRGTKKNPTALVAA